MLKEVWGTKVPISPGHAVGSQVKLLGSHRSHHCQHTSGLCHLMCLGVSWGCRLWQHRAGGGEERGAELSLPRAPPCRGHAGSAPGTGSRRAGTLPVVTNQKMTQMKADPCSAGGHVPVTVLALNMLLINTRLWVGIADS